MLGMKVVGFSLWQTSQYIYSSLSLTITEEHIDVYILFYVLLPFW